MTAKRDATFLDLFIEVRYFSSVDINFAMAVAEQWGSRFNGPWTIPSCNSGSARHGAAVFQAAKVKPC